MFISQNSFSVFEDIQNNKWGNNDKKDKKSGQIVRRMVSNICCPSKKQINVKMPEYFFRIH